ncbi:hypothetical protein [Helicobacter sp. UBA3407]|nr:hypothetical protein [Helicobacter sp. UBA3407]
MLMLFTRNHCQANLNLPGNEELRKCGIRTMKIWRQGIPTTCLFF